MDPTEKKKKYPWFVLVIADILLSGIILCTFSYFHHVRMLWGLGKYADDDQMQLNFEKNGENIGHVTHEWVFDRTVAPSCTEGGYTRYICKCGAEKIEDRTPPTGHQNTELRGAYEATYEEKGYTGDLYCNDCGELITKGSEIPSKQHENLTLINKRETTCTEPGYSGDWYCLDCKEIVGYGSETPLAEHQYVKKQTVSPTCEEEGYTLYECSVCKTEKKDDYLPVIDHIVGSDGKCTMCGIVIVDMGDFGASFPEMFIEGSDRLTFTNDSEIREYAANSGITLKDHEDGKFIALYRSHDIFISILEVNTDLYYEGTNKTYYVQYYVYDIYVRNIENLFTSYTTSSRKDTEKLISDAEKLTGDEVIAAMNGDYMGNKNHCLVCNRNGKDIRMPESIESDACILYYDGTMETVTPQEYDREAIKAKHPYQIWNFGPALIDGNGEAIEKYSNASFDHNVVDQRHPRASMGYYEPGHYNFIVVDGRSDDSQGVRMVQLARLHEEFGSVAAYNMDGGDSAQSFFQDSEIRVDEDRGDAQRKLYDIICIGEVSSS